MKFLIKPFNKTHWISDPPTPLKGPVECSRNSYRQSYSSDIWGKFLRCCILKRNLTILSEMF